jgi:hypothetical protein
LTPDGKIYLPHRLFVHNNLGSEIRALYEIRTVTAAEENPIMRATFECDELENVRQEYLEDSEVDGIRGYGFELSKKSVNGVAADAEAPLQNAEHILEQVDHYFCIHNLFLVFDLFSIE